MEHLVLPIELKQFFPNTKINFTLIYNSITEVIIFDVTHDDGVKLENAIKAENEKQLTHNRTL